MPKREKKERGRPLKKLYPPRVDATPEDMAQAMFSLPAGRKWKYMEAGPEGPLSSGPHRQDSGEAKIRESTAGVSRKPSSDGKARGSSSKHLCGLTTWNT